MRLNTSSILKRLEPLYTHYRVQCQAADALSEVERRQFRVRSLQYLRRVAKLRSFDMPTQKNEVRDKPKQFLSATWWPSVGAATGGTTGAPLRLKRSLNSVVYEQATIDHLLHKLGVRASSASIAVLRADSIKEPSDCTPPFWVDAGRRRIFSSMHMTRDTFPLYVKALEELRPQVLHCYPSTLELLVKYSADLRPSISPKVVLTSSEFLPQHLFAEVASLWGSRLLDVYGQAERVCMAWATEPGKYLFRHDYGAVWLRNQGLEGIVCGTGYRNLAQVLPNYNTGDRAMLPLLDDQYLALVELGIAEFGGIEGRTKEAMLLPDGRQIVGFNHIPRLAKGVDYVQFKRSGPLSLDVIVVRNSEFSDETLSVIERNMRLKVPPEVVTQFVFAEHPVRTKSGKAPLYMDT